MKQEKNEDVTWCKIMTNYTNQCGIQSIFYNNQVLHFIPTFCLSCGVQSLVPAFSNISKLIFNNDQALLLLVQNYDYLQTDLNSKYICVVNAIQLLLLRSTDKTQTTIRFHNKKHTRYEARKTEDVTWCKIMTKDRFISISLSLSSLVKSQTEGTDIHPPTEFNLEKQFAIMSAYCLSKVHTIHAPDLLQLLSRWWGVERYAGISHGGRSWHGWKNNSWNVKYLTRW